MNKERLLILQAACSHADGQNEPSLHGEWRLKNLFEQFALKDGCRRSNAKTFALLKESDLVGVLAGEIQFVGDDDNRVAVCASKPAQRFQQIDLRADIEMQRRLVQKEKQRLLREGARQNDALFFAAGNLVHQAIAEMFGAYLRECVARDENVFFGFEAQHATIGMSSLEDKFPGARREQQRAFLLDHGDALAAGAMRKRVRDEAVQEERGQKAVPARRK